jgi:hypothetical protein
MGSVHENIQRPLFLRSPGIGQEGFRSFIARYLFIPLKKNIILLFCLNILPETLDIPHCNIILMPLGITK